MTALPNRRAFTDDLAATRAGGLLALDVDHLLAYNDRYGHAAGDSYLVAVGQAITAATGPDDTVYRVGGDEFATLLAGHGRAGGLRHRRDGGIAAVRTVRMTTGDDGLPASASAGLTLLGPSPRSPERRLPDTRRRSGVVSGQRAGPRSGGDRRGQGVRGRKIDPA